MYVKELVYLVLSICASHHETPINYFWKSMCVLPERDNKCWYHVKKLFKN